MSWELFTWIVDQFPRIARVVLHGVGEPMMVRDLPRMIRYLKDRGTYVLFNTNGTLADPSARDTSCIDSGLDELRVSLDAAEPEAFKPGPRPRHVRPHRPQPAALHGRCSAQQGVREPRVSLWLTGLKETIGAAWRPSCAWRTSWRSARSICNGWSISPRARGWRAASRALFERMARNRRWRLIREAEALAARSRHRLQRLGRDRAGKRA